MKIHSERISKPYSIVSTSEVDDDGFEHSGVAITSQGSVRFFAWKNTMAGFDSSSLQTVYNGRHHLTFFDRAYSVRYLVTLSVKFLKEVQKS